MLTSLCQAFLEQIAECCHTDAHGQFRVADGRRYKVVTESVTAEAIRAHAANKQPIMVFPLMGDQTRVAVLDFDNHDGSLTWEQMAESVRPIVDSLQADGLKPSLFRSGGGGGIHVWIIWKAPQAAKQVRVYLAELLHRHGFKSGSRGVAKGDAEVFPKQNSVEAGGFGSGIALPLARKSVPLDADLRPLDTATWTPPLDDTMFSDHHAVVTASCTESEVAKAIDRVVLDGDLEEAEAALKNVPSDDYGLWITIGHALKNTFGDEGFQAWQEWSSKSQKAEDEVALKKLPPARGHFARHGVPPWAAAWLEWAIAPGRSEV